MVVHAVYPVGFRASVLEFTPHRMSAEHCIVGTPGTKNLYELLRTASGNYSTSIIEADKYSKCITNEGTRSQCAARLLPASAQRSKSLEVLQG